MDKTYDRYERFRESGTVKIVPFCPIEESSGDIYVTYVKNRMRLDLLSYKYYGNANFGWLIMQANPEYGSMEYSIKDGVLLRIPYPLDSALSRYNKSISIYELEHNS